MDCCSKSYVSIPDVPDDLGLDRFIWYIYTEKSFTDVEFILETPAGTCMLSAHKMVLAMWSSIFEDMFYKGEMQDTVYLELGNSYSFERMLRFMYGCEPILSSYRDACELCKVAAKFGVTALSTLCQYYLMDVDVDVGNVFDILETAELVKNRNLMNRCMELLESETDILFARFTYGYFSPAMIQIILNLRELSLDSEFQLINWIFAWAKDRVRHHGMYRSIREVLKEFLPRLNFLALTMEQFVTICRHHFDCFSNEEVVGILMNIGNQGSISMPNWYDNSAEFRVYRGRQNDFV